MNARCWPPHLLLGAFLLSLAPLASAPACCPAPPLNKPVVNADQTVIMLWDPTTRTQHFIRQASFKSAADDFGFLVPTPAQPELAESGNEAFPYLLKVTEPETVKVARPTGGGGCVGGCSKSALPEAALGVRVLDEKQVAGFDAVVLEAKSADALVGWLKEHGYSYSPEVAAWARPYVDAGWKITALKVAKDKGDQQKPSVTASALRLTFQTDRPLFPYREPASKSAAEALGAKERMLRIYFVADARYQGELTKDVPWTGKVAWADKLKAEDRTRLLEMLKLPATTGPEQMWLTEFEDNWPYQTAPADLSFARDGDQSTVKRKPFIVYVSAPLPADVTGFALVAAIVLPPLVRRARASCNARR